MHPSNDKIQIAKLAFAVTSCLIISLSATSAQAQQWLHPELVKPLPQYQYPASTNRYPLNEPKPAEKNMQTPSGEIKPTQQLLPGQRSGQQLSINPLASQSERPLRQNPALDSDQNPGGLGESARTIDNPNQSQKQTLSPTTRKQPPAIAATGSDRTASRKQKNAKPVPRTPEVNYSIYRDVATYPLDPRKPSNPCTKGPSCGCGQCSLVSPSRSGIYGRPHRVKEPGGYTCGKNCPNKRPQFSVFWPRPFSAKLDERFPDAAAKRYQPCQPKKLVDVFDSLSNFRLIDYNRTDNGYCGPGSDPYGCLGESRVAGLGFRLPGESVNNRYSLTLEKGPASIVR